MNATVVEKLKGAFASAIESSEEFRGELTVTVRKPEIVSVCRFLRDDAALSYDCLRDLLGVDDYRTERRFEVVYNLYSLKNKHRIRLKVFVEESDPHVPTVTGIWNSADYHEREAYDMFGIVFDGHPDLRRIYMPEEFEHHPLRKDFPLMGIPGSLPLPRK